MNSVSVVCEKLSVTGAGHNAHNKRAKSPQAAVSPSWRHRDPTSHRVLDLQYEPHLSSVKGPVSNVPIKNNSRSLTAAGCSWGSLALPGPEIHELSFSSRLRGLGAPWIFRNLCDPALRSSLRASHALLCRLNHPCVLKRLPHPLHSSVTIRGWMTRVTLPVREVERGNGTARERDNGTQRESEGEEGRDMSFAASVGKVRRRLHYIEGTRDGGWLQHCITS